MAIQSFSDKATEEFFISGKTRKRTGWTQIGKVVKRKLDILHFANELTDLKVMPGNRLEILKEDLTGYHSIRINDQWRLIFKWSDSGANDVRIADHH